MTRRRSIRRSVAACGLLALHLTGCRRAEAPSPGAAAPKTTADRIEFAPNAPQLKELRIEPAAEGTAASLSLTGRLTWDEDVTARVIPPVAGRITRLAADAGERVSRGTVLAALSSPDFGQAQADGTRAAADLAAAERTRDRVSRLVERGASARKDLEAAETDLARARAEERRTRERLHVWGGTIASSPDQRYLVRAPLDGVVVERNLNPAQEVRPDATTPLFVVSDPSRLWILLDVTERDLSLIGKGDRLIVRSTAYPNKDFSGRIAWIGDSLDPSTRTVRVRGEVQNPGGLLKSEMYVAADDIGERPRTTVVIPASAVITNGGKPFCFLEESPREFRRIPIEVGPEREGRVPVRSGLPPKARIVTEGGLLLSTFLPSESGS